MIFRSLCTTVKSTQLFSKNCILSLLYRSNFPLWLLRTNWISNLLVENVSSTSKITFENTSYSCTLGNPISKCQNQAVVQNLSVSISLHSRLHCNFIANGLSVHRCWHSRKYSKRSESKSFRHLTFIIYKSNCFSDVITKFDVHCFIHQYCVQSVFVEPKSEFAHFFHTTNGVIFVCAKKRTGTCVSYKDVSFRKFISSSFI